MKIIVAGSVKFPASNGQAVFTENLVTGLAGLGHEVLSISPSEKKHSYSAIRNSVEIEAIRSIDLTKIHPDSYLTLFSKKEVEQIIQKFKPDIIHVQDHFPLSRAVIIAARKFHIPMIGTNHFMPENFASFAPSISPLPFYKQAMWNWMLSAYNLLNVVTAQSNASAALMQKYGLNTPVFKVSCGIDFKSFSPSPKMNKERSRIKFGVDPAKFTLLFVGRVDQEKRLDILIRAINQLQRDDIQLVIAGIGRAKIELEQLAKELNTGNRVIFSGYIPTQDLPELIKCADIFTMPSEAELLSIATIEAMACGLPILVANAVALPELVTDGQNGFTFQAGSFIDAAEKINLLCDHPEKWPAMGAASLSRSRFHSLDTALEQYVRIYSRTINGYYQDLSLQNISSKKASADLQTSTKNN